MGQGAGLIMSMILLFGTKIFSVREKIKIQNSLKCLIETISTHLLYSYECVPKDFTLKRPRSNG